MITESAELKVIIAVAEFKGTTGILICANALTNPVMFLTFDGALAVAANIIELCENNAPNDTQTTN